MLTDGLFSCGCGDFIVQSSDFSTLANLVLWKKRLAMFPLKYFDGLFEVLDKKWYMETAKSGGEKKFSPEVFFPPCRKTVNAQNGRSKQLCRIFICCFHSLKEVGVVEVYFAVFQDIPPTCKTMADNDNHNNNRYVWSNKVTKVFQDLIQKT